MGPLQSEFDSLLSTVGQAVGFGTHFVNQRQQIKMQETQSQLEHGAAHQEAVGKEEQKIRRRWLRMPGNAMKDLVDGNSYNQYAAEHLQK